MSEDTSVLSGVPPSTVFILAGYGKSWRLGGRTSIVEELIEWNFESSGELFECFNRWDGVTVLYARDIATQQSGSLLNVSLRSVLCFSQVAQAVSNWHV